MSASVHPSAIRPITNSIEMRVPRMTGLPANIVESSVMRVCSAIMDHSLLHPTIPDCPVSCDADKMRPEHGHVPVINSDTQPRAACERLTLARAAASIRRELAVNIGAQNDLPHRRRPTHLPSPRAG